MATIDYTELFLETFKEIEKLINNIYGVDCNYKWYEDKIAEEKPEISKKMYVCRVLRNYIVHNPDHETFIKVSKETVDFLISLRDSIDKELKSCKEILKRVTGLSITDNIISATKKLDKSPIVPILDANKQILGYFTNDILRKCIVNEISMKKKMKDITLLATNKVSYFKPTTKYEDILSILENEKIVFITDDGTKNGKFIGEIQL
jgi:hypothetical protein